MASTSRGTRAARGRKPGRGQKFTGSIQGGTKNKGTWPVYDIEYEDKNGIMKKLRLEWHHQPKSQEKVLQTIAVVKNYVDDPKDKVENPMGATFKTYSPDFCIILEDPHFTSQSKTDRPADEYYHVSLRFSRTQDRRIDQGYSWGYSVHVYVNPDTYEYRKVPVKWRIQTFDAPEHYSVYRNRTAWPDDTGPDYAQWAPGQRPQPPPSTAGQYTEATVPNQSAWVSPFSASQTLFPPKPPGKG